MSKLLLSMTSPHCMQVICLEGNHFLVSRIKRFLIRQGNQLKKSQLSLRYESLKKSHLTLLCRLLHFLSIIMQERG